MFDTTIDVNTLLDIVKKNRDEHVELLKEANTGFKQQCISELSSKLEEYKDMDESNPVGLSVLKNPPNDYTHRYEEAIAMLELTKDVTIKVTPEQFKSLVLNKWEWSRNFYVANSIYSSGCTAKLKEF